MRAVKGKEAVVKKVGRSRLPVREKGAISKSIFFLGQNRKARVGISGWRRDDHPLALPFLVFRA